jgi:hypothetical protein
MPRLLDRDRLGLHLGQQSRGEAAQLLGVFRHGQGSIQHAVSLSVHSRFVRRATPSP